MRLLFFISAIIALSSIAQSDSTIDTQIDQIMKAPASKRVELMNELKTKLAAMNTNERNDALQKLSARRGGNLQGGAMNQGSVMQQNRLSSMNAQQQMNATHQRNQPNRH